MSTLAGTATPLLRPRSRSCWLMLRQSGVSNGVLMLRPHIATQRARFHLAGKCFTRLHNPNPRSATNGETRVTSYQELVRATACDVVDRLNAGEVTPLDLLDAL